MCFSTVKAQADVDYVKSQYPEVYNDIYSRAIAKYSDVALQEKSIQEQVYSFLELAESDSPVDEAMMTESLLKWSTPGYEDYNQNIIEDTTVENPFPQLRCDWILARIHYNRVKSGIDKYSDKQTAVAKVVSDRVHKCNNCAQKDEKNHRYEPKIPSMASMGEFNQKVECTSNGECVVCKSTSSARDFCSHLTSDYIQLLNKRYEKSER